LRKKSTHKIVPTNRFFITLIAIFCSLVSWPAPPVFAAHDITVILSSRLEPYIEALQGFTDSMAATVPRMGPKSIQYAEIKEFFLTEENRSELHRRVESHPPRLFIAIGTNGFAFLKNIRAVPIIYLMVPFPETLIDKRTNITGVNLQISPGRQLEVLCKAMPNIKRIGLIHDPLRFTDFINQLTAAARERKIELLIKETKHSNNIARLLAEMTGRIDLFWMLPDLTVTTPQTVEHILLFSLEQNVPVLTFSEKFLTRGAAFAVTFDHRGMGETAATLAKDILSGRKTSSTPPIEPERVRLRINSNVIDKLGISLKPGTETNDEVP
jgi:putative ABC transport system substrate-binding protein